MLSAEGADMERLFARAGEVRTRTVGDRLYLRGLIEYSNLCRKDCLYCGIRRSNGAVIRYTLTREQVLAAARTAYEAGMGSVVLQGGENSGKEHTETIERLVKDIKRLSGGRLGITLSLGEQSADTLKRWFDAGAHRYLLRIETSSPELYVRLHPRDGRHSYEKRLGVLHDLRRIGYQVGTGVMIGLPYQTIEDLAGDICFMRDLDIDMCGMGPYIESENTPLAGVAGMLGRDGVAEAAHGRELMIEVAALEWDVAAMPGLGCKARSVVPERERAAVVAVLGHGGSVAAMSGQGGAGGSVAAVPGRGGADSAVVAGEVPPQGEAGVFRPQWGGGANGAIPSPARRLELSLKMIAVLRLVMPDINIASTTALNSLSPDGRYRAVMCGANVIMPNITPEAARKLYSLYDNKLSEIDPRLSAMDIGYGEWGDSLHFRK